MRCGEHTKKIFRNIDFTCHNLIYWFQSRSVLVGHCDPAFSLLRLFLFVNSDTRGNAEVWGRGRFSKRSASPPDPLSRRVAGNRLVRSFGLACPCSMGAFFCFGVEVTAADRAAATYATWGTNPSARFAGTSPFRGGFARVSSKGLPPQKEGDHSRSEWSDR